MSVQIHRRETRTSGGVQIKGQLRLRPWATVIRITCSLSRVECYTAFALRLPNKARRGRSACPTSALGSFPDFSASRTMCALPRQTPSECPVLESARSGTMLNRTVVRWDRPPGAISHRQALERARLRRRLQLAGDPAGRDRIHRVLATAFVKPWSHFLHSNVRSSRPSGPGAIPTSIMRPSHFGHPGRRIGSRQGSGRVYNSGMMHSPADQGGSRLLLPPVDAVDMR